MEKDNAAMLANISMPDGSKKISSCNDNISTVFNPTTTTSTTTTTPSNTTSPPSPPAKKQKTSTETSIVVMTTVVETPVVSTTASQSPTASTTSSKAIILSIPEHHTTLPSPKKTYTRKRKFQIDDEDIPTHVPISSAPYNVIPPQPFIPPILATPITDPKLIEGHDPANVVPIAATYPLELEAVKNEMKQFYTEDDPSKSRFHSLIGFRNPTNLDGYLKLKTR
ncbi:hypothetical protein Hanom_Chr06g00563401 [Helianthus anomalus]